MAQALRPAKPSIQARNDALLRCLSTTSRHNVALPKDAQNMRAAPRDHQGTLKAPLVNPADKYQSKADDMHKYGSWLMGCLPKYIQQFSVWKDELTIYICPSGVIPVFSFLKCQWLPDLPILRAAPNYKLQITPQPNSPRSAISPPLISRPETSDSKLSTTS